MLSRDKHVQQLDQGIMKTVTTKTIEYNVATASQSRVSSITSSSKTSPAIEANNNNDHRHHKKNEKTCRICLSKGYPGLLSRNGPLVHPCWCKGSIGLVHKSCLEKWLTMSQSDSCDLCTFKFDLTQRPKSLSIYWSEIESRVRCYLLTDMICFLLLTPVTFASLDLCLRGVYYYATTTWEVIGLAVLIFLLLLTYILWLGTCLYQHGRQIRAWRRENLQLSLVIQPVKHSVNQDVDGVCLV